jgi:2-polyprenyl-3-methyl-5-hydroxy-6-metoxy-1,4-benzoquinol methylase
MNPRPESNPELTPLACDLCGSVTVRELYTAKDRLRNTDLLFSIAECFGCGVLRTLPDMSDAELARYYPDDYWGGAGPSQTWIESSQSEKTRFLSRCGLAGGSILDVGCGSGFFLRALSPARWERFGVETSEAAARAAERAAGSGHVFAGTLTQSAWADSTFDVVTFWSALEHTNEPRANLREAKRIIKRGGSLIVQAPNAASYQARFFGADWFALDAPRHRYHFTLSLLDRLLSEIGFEVYRVTYFSKAHNSHALRQSLKSKLLSRESHAFNRTLFYLSIPFIKPCDLLMTALGEGATLTVAARAV